MTREQLERIAALIAALPPGNGYPSVSLSASDPATVEALTALGGEPTANVYGDGYVIHSSRLTLHGVEIRAQYNRPATADELRALETRGHVYDPRPGPLRAAALRPSNGVPIAVGKPDAETVSAAIVPGPCGAV